MLKKLEDIAGIGPVKAEVIMKHGIGGIKLRDDVPVRTQLKNKMIFPLLSKLTQADLTYKPCKKIPRKTIQEIEKDLSTVLKQKHIIAGSYLRGKPISRDMDLLIIHPEFTTSSAQHLIGVINKMKNTKIIHIFSLGPNKIGAILEHKGINIKIDIFAANKNNYTFMLLFATGSAKFNIQMRAVAKNKGYLLNQNGLYTIGTLKQVPIGSERELFSVLNITYRGPSER
jgi:DNA polymerase beta